jgi:putative tributyrin esterase
MALIHCRFFSHVLTMDTSMTVLLPNPSQHPAEPEAEKHPVLYLLHGYTDDDSAWTRKSSIERYAADAGIAVVMPNVHKSFYTDMAYGDKYWTFLSEEVPHVARSLFPISAAREDNFAAGLSMGGYGAFKWALRKPEQFAAAASLSGALDMAEHHVRRSGTPMERDLYHIYGDQGVAGTEDDLLRLVARGPAAGVPQTKLYQCCGTEDFLYEDNLRFRDACRSAGFDLTYQEGPGEHVWNYWDEHIQNVLKWLPIRKRT